MKKQPDLNKLRFIKLHRKKRIIRVNKGNKGKKLSSYNLGVVLQESKVLTVSQLESAKKLIIRKLKARKTKNQKNLKIIKSQVKVKSKKTKKKVNSKTLILRHNFNLGLTKKPLQVRMGKGKGSPVDWVYPCAKNRILIEFSTARMKIKKIKRILDKSGDKLPCNIKYNRINYNKSKKLKTYLGFNNLGEKNKLVTCVKEL